MIQGMSPKQSKKMIFIGNLVIGFFATIIGSIGGILFSQVILWVSNQLIHVDFSFYLSIKAFGLTIWSFFLVSIISTVAFMAIETLYGFKNMMLESINELPYEFDIIGKKEDTTTANKKFIKYLTDHAIQTGTVSISQYTDLTENIIFVKA